MKKILVAEDNDSNFILMTYVLRGRYDFERARHGQEAVQMATATPYDLVLMDMKMPVMDGLQATALIKQQLPSLPVVALTANVFDADRQACLDAGCDAFLSKPISRDLCLQTIERLIGE